jgi:hypothetical protein
MIIITDCGNDATLRPLLIPGHNDASPPPPAIPFPIPRAALAAAFQPAENIALGLVAGPIPGAFSAAFDAASSAPPPVKRPMASFIEFNAPMALFALSSASSG